LRPAKVKQKVSNCFRTLAGAACYARIAGFMAPATRLHHEKEQTERLRSIDRRSKRQLHLGYLNNYKSLAKFVNYPFDFLCYKGTKPTFLEM
jgi:hypothetical protein